MGKNIVMCIVLKNALIVAKKKTGRKACFKFYVRPVSHERLDEFRTLDFTYEFIVFIRKKVFE